MKKPIASLAVWLALSSGAAFGQSVLTPVATTSHKGSLLIFPLITVDPTFATDTVIQISSDSPASAVHILCTYVNELNGRVNFGFDMAPNQTVTWEVGTSNGNDIAAGAFPVWVGSPSYANGSVYRGELVCFATDTVASQQISFNHLLGTATVLSGLPTASGPSTGPKTAFSYGAWSFVARDDFGNPTGDGLAVGAPGRLLLTGGGLGTYDACPALNTASFMPIGATVGDLTVLDNRMSVVSCNQDLRQDFALHPTKLQFTVRTAFEESFDASWECVNNVETVRLDAGNSALTNPSNFYVSTTKTASARLEAAGVSSDRCSGPTENVGLLGLMISVVGINDQTADQVVAKPMTTVGSSQGLTNNGQQSGFVYWDPGRNP